MHFLHTYNFLIRFLTSFLQNLNAHAISFKMQKVQLKKANLLFVTTMRLEIYAESNSKKDPQEQISIKATVHIMPDLFIRMKLIDMASEFNITSEIRIAFTNSILFI